MKLSLFTFATSYLLAFSAAITVAYRNDSVTALSKPAKHASDLINEFGTASSDISSFSNLLLGGADSGTNFTSGLEGIVSSLNRLAETVTSVDLTSLATHQTIPIVSQFLSTLLSLVIHLSLFVLTNGADAIPGAAHLLSTIISLVATIVASLVDGNSAFEVLISPFTEIAKLLEGTLNLF